MSKDTMNYCLYIFITSMSSPKTLKLFELHKKTIYPIKENQTIGQNAELWCLVPAGISTIHSCDVGVPSVFFDYH